MTMNALKNRQSGIALVIALVLLLAITLVGLASIRGTTLQEKMSSNLQDRDIAFQAAEAALRIAERRIADTTADIWHDCSLGGVTCEALPSGGSVPRQTVPAGPAADEFNAGALSAAQPQYVVENMGLWPDPTSNTGVNLSGAASQYGAQGTSTTINFYRVTARSADPSVASDRAIVVLQTWVRG
jgi:type IV pilus assembly protein PilX